MFCSYPRNLKNFGGGGAFSLVTLLNFLIFSLNLTVVWEDMHLLM